RVVEVLGDTVRGCPLLEEDALGERGGVVVSRALGDAAKLLVTADLEVLERVRERRQLARRVWMSLEERCPVDRTEAQRSVLQRRDVAAERLEPRRHEHRMLARLREVLVVDMSEGAVAQAGRALEQLDRLLLERVRVGEVLAQPLARAVAVARLERRGGRAVEARLEPLHHRALLAADLARDA